MTDSSITEIGIQAIDTGLSADQAIIAMSPILVEKVGSAKDCEANEDNCNQAFH